MNSLSPLQITRLSYSPQLPKSLTGMTKAREEQVSLPEVSEAVSSLFPHTREQSLLLITPVNDLKPELRAILRVGVVFSGGPAPGGHNVITGLFDALEKWNPGSLLFGFQDGPAGVMKNKQKQLTKELLALYRNQGGFDLLGSGRDKIETPEQLDAARSTMENLHLDALIVIGGDDSNTNAAILAEYFKANQCKTAVIGVPKTIDGDLQNAYIEQPFGFDTACKVYSEIIGNLLRDALSAKKHYYFVKIMGRSASHVALECALKTHPNMTFISEEIAQRQQTLKSIVDEIVELIIKRHALGKEYGLILIPEGIVEFVPEIKILIAELNQLVANHTQENQIVASLTPNSARCFESLPPSFQKQLLLTRDAHGNVQVSKIEIDRLLIDMATNELAKRCYQGKFNAQPFFCGYEGRSALPTNFDAQYCYALGYVAAALVKAGATGVISCLCGLHKPVEDWVPYGIPLVSMMTIEKRKGKEKPVIQKALVDLQGSLFAHFKAQRESWVIDDLYSCPGPIQF